MSSKHLGIGSVLPPFSGKLRIYSMRFCPYAQRTILVLNAKKIDYEVINVNLTEKPEWLLSKSPNGTVPALEVAKDVCIPESLVTAEYVEDKYPLPQLVSSNPLRKAQDKLIVENFAGVTTTFYKTLMSKGEIDESLVTKFFQGLEAVQGELSKRGSKFLAGATPGMVDYMIWPWFERFGLLLKYGSARFAIDKSKFSLLNAWIEAMKQDPAVAAHFLDLETHGKYLEGRLKGTPDYELLNK